MQIDSICKIPNTMYSSLLNKYVAKVMAIAAKKIIRPRLKLLRLKNVHIPEIKIKRDATIFLSTFITPWE